MGLPFLDAMVPARTALAQTAAAPKLRIGFFYFPHGAIMGNTSHGPAMDKWTPSGAGANFKLSPILSPLEPYKKYVSSFGNLENAARRQKSSEARAMRIVSTLAAAWHKVEPRGGTNAGGSFARARSRRADRGHPPGRHANFESERAGKIASGR